MPQSQDYDIIGDIHGHANDLIALLEKLGYNNSTGYYQHPTKMVVFLGDFIDRGCNQRRVLEIVMPMIESGSAYAVMGNHEFNALCFHTRDPENPERWLRAHNNKNIGQHKAFLEAYSDSSDEMEIKRILEFFMKLPLWLDLDGFRVVHASWDDSTIEAIQPLLGENNTLDKDFLVQATQKGTIEYDAIETLLKGIQMELPEGVIVYDAQGIGRNEARVRWWLNKAETMGELTLGMDDEEYRSLPTGDNSPIGYPASAKPVFIGHYWFEGHPALLSPNVACVDYSIAKGGKLLAYTWKGEQELKEEGFVSVG